MHKFLLTALLPVFLLSACSSSSTSPATGDNSTGQPDIIDPDNTNANNPNSTANQNNTDTPAGSDASSGTDGSNTDQQPDTNNSPDTDSNGEADSNDNDSNNDADTNDNANNQPDTTINSTELLRAGISHTGSDIATSPAIANDPLVLRTGFDRVAALPDPLAIMFEVAHNQGTSTGLDCSGLGAQFNSCNVVNLHIKDAGGVLSDDSWKLYFHMTRRVLKVESDEFTVRHVNGDLHYVAPQANFGGFSPAVKTIKMITEFQNLAESDFQPRYWISRGNDITLIPNTDDDTDESKYSMEITGNNRFEFVGENNPIATSSVRFTRNQDVSAAANNLSAQQIQSRIIPKPQSITTQTGSLNINGGLTFALNGLPAASVQALQARLTQITGASGIQVIGNVDSNLPANTYNLSVNASGITLNGSDSSMLFYAAQSVLALVQSGVDTIPFVTITDSPRADYRGMHIDVARNFHSVASLQKLMDQMAAYKLNRLHLHLADDEGWRLEIPSLPELTSVGGQRAFKVDANGLVTETDSLMPAMGSGPNNNNQGSGFYTQQEFINLLQYADARFIQIIPEFDMPAHARAAVVSMRARALARGDANDINVRLDDPNDTSVYLTVQNYNDSIINPCLPGTYNFINTLVSSVKGLYDSAGLPLDVWHMGGDEAINILTGGGFFGQDTSAFDEPWARSPVCEAYIANTSGVNSREELGAHFIQRVSQIVSNAGISTLVAFSDAFNGIAAEQLQTTSVATNFWSTLSSNGSGTSDAANQLQNRGIDIILSLPDFLYFDFPYEVDPEERGYYWATRANGTRKVFTFSPENLPQNAETSFNKAGNPWSATGQRAHTGFAGTEAMLWSETVRTPEQFDYMLFPRLLAYAERAWHRASWELPYVAGQTFDANSGQVDSNAIAQDYAEFAAAVGQKELAKLDAAGVQYRIPLPGALSNGGQLTMNIGLPGLALEYSLDGSTWNTWNGVSPNGNVMSVRTRSADGTRTSRSAPLQ